MFRLLLLVFLFCSLNVNAESEYADYVVDVGDQVSVKVYRSEDLTTDARVSSSGEITFPLLGKVKVAGHTTMEIEKIIKDALVEKKLLVAPQVNVSVSEYLSKTFAILGYVNEPGKYPIKQPMNLTDAIAGAGGYTEAASDVVTIVSKDNGKTLNKSYDIKKLLNSTSSELNPEIKNGDIIQVPKHEVFYIYGQVNNPGEYKLEANIRVSQALAKGGGVTLRGTTNSIVIERKGLDGEVSKIAGKLDVLLEANDVVYVKESWF